MIVMGIDPGLATTGWGVVEQQNGVVKLHGYGVVETAARQKLPERLQILRESVRELTQTYRAEHVVIEQLFFTKFASTIASTAQARGVILEAIASCKVPITEYNPRSIKMAVSGYGSAQKFQMQSMIQKLFQLKAFPEPDDAADALAVAWCHLQTNRLTVPVS